MATTTSARATPPGSRPSSSVPSRTTSPPSPSIARGATARSAVSPRVTASLNSPAVRRSSLKGATSPPPVVNGETRESLSASLKQETEKKEQLLVQLQDKDQAITTLRNENDSLTSSLNAAESRLAEFYADQGRMEEEMAARIEVIEKLRNQVRDLEKEKRDIHRRYNEQTATFEAERQAFYDNEQHLKSRIQSLTQARKQPPQPIPFSPSSISVAESETEVEEDDPQESQTQSTKQDMTDPEQEPAEMTALKLELSTLSTSHTSLQSTLVLLQSQLVDLKRVNHELQEENESYNILLREKTLNGQFDVLRMGGNSVSEASESSAGDDDADDESKDAESLRSRNTTRSTLDPVDELAEEHDAELDPGFGQEQEQEQEQELREEEVSGRAGRSRHSRKRSSVSAPRGESLANLPITGPGLDLAAELGRAENKDILDGQPALEQDRSVVNPKSRKGKKASISDTSRKVSSMSEPSIEPSGSVTDLDALRNEVKSLKDANKALSLYASKIIDRIISQEGFEHVLAVDYEKSPSGTPANATFTTFSNLPPKSPNPPPAPKAKKPRPQTAIFNLSSSSTVTQLSPPQERLTTFDSPPTPSTATPQGNGPPTASATTRANRRSLSFDWKSFSMFGGEKKPDHAANLRPLTLRAGSGPMVTSARKLETHEDEEDRRERERLHATMKLMGIEKPMTPLPSPGPLMQKSFSSPVQPTSGFSEMPPMSASATAPTPSRFSFFRRSNSVNAASESSSVHSSVQGSPALPNGGNTPNLTQDALEQAEAENTIAALDAHERKLSSEIAKGAGGGFTEITRRSGDRRSSRKSGGSGSTVWSAGMSRGEDED